MLRCAAAFWDVRARLIRCLPLDRTAPAYNTCLILMSVLAVCLNSVSVAQEKVGHRARQPALEAFLDESGNITSELPQTAPPTFLTGATEHRAEDGEDEEDEEEEEEDQVTPIIEELFLGTVVYPQEQDEVQLTFGYFEGLQTLGNSELLFEVEYGITDRLQIGFGVPVESAENDEPFTGVRNLDLELYYNFYNEPKTGRAYGVGFEFGLPVDAAAGESRTCVYEPFFVAYQEYCDFALNISAALEIEDPFADDDATETAGDIAFGIIGKAGDYVPLLELQVEIASQETPVLLAPGLYMSSFIKPFDVAVSFPIGLNDDAPDFAVFFLAVVEFEAGVLPRRSTR